MIAYCRAALSTTSSSITYNDHHHHHNTKHVACKKKSNRLLALHLNMKRQPKCKVYSEIFFISKCNARSTLFSSHRCRWSVYPCRFSRVLFFPCYSKYIHIKYIESSVHNFHSMFTKCSCVLLNKREDHQKQKRRRKKSSWHYVHITIIAI